ncbi:dynamin family protein [Actinoplanes sp. NPDC026619]|uniref:dynamin family protein n=1 Tax=Actinoplanes sp. NPDC026619 TaxID=3155798 RepID=UPI0033CFC0EF
MSDSGFVSDPGTGLPELISTVRAEAIALGRDDLAAQLPGPIGAGITMRRLRVVVAGEPGAGKSSLINSLLGRPGLSPPATGCWIEFRYGAADSATILLADPADAGTPRRLPADLGELSAHVALGEITAPVVGAEVRLDVPVLRELVLVDTPGAPTPTTLAALRQADALLYVCDATRPIPLSAVELLVEAVRRVQTVAVAMNKSETPAHGRAVAETRRRLGDRPELARAAVHTVSAHLAERAERPGTPHSAAIRLTESAGVRQLMDRLLYDAGAGAARLRTANQARTAAAVARSLLTHLDQVTGPAARIDADLAVLGTLLDAGGVLGARFDQARQSATSRYAAAAGELSAALPPAHVIAALTAAGVDALDDCQARILDALRDGLRDGVLLPSAPDTELRLRAPDASRPRALDLLPTVTGLVTGSALVVSVLTGSPAVSTAIAVSACAGWWRTAEENRSTWLEAATTQAKAAFESELRRRAGAARQYVAETVPFLLEARRDRLALLDAPSLPGEAEGSRALLNQALADLSRYHRSNA